jgi:hypothetical protein
MGGVSFYHLMDEVVVTACQACVWRSGHAGANPCSLGKKWPGQSMLTATCCRSARGTRKTWECESALRTAVTHPTRWKGNRDGVRCLVRLAGIEPTTLGFGGQSAYIGEAALLLQLLDFTEYSNRQQKAIGGTNGKKIPSFLPKFSPHLAWMFSASYIASYLNDHASQYAENGERDNEGPSTRTAMQELLIQRR